MVTIITTKKASAFELYHGRPGFRLLFYNALDKRKKVVT